MIAILRRRDLASTSKTGRVGFPPRPESRSANPGDLETILSVILAGPPRGRQRARPGVGRTHHSPIIVIKRSAKSK
ncbi:hypothetical protein [Caulobacter sp. UNC279MFTsu5.1]|uniref:hypothetical protein n=1 Tax=Caulobacter sp. UNC279MFTsu5.1 TaxID=1502775 RepID=UPI0011606A5A|nr:hypothetical protein [Caulobacter sp. UNC279MFTsu5.1]